MAIYSDKKDKKHEIDDVGLEKAVKYKIELQRDNGRANWNKVARLLREDGYDAKQCEGFRQAVKKKQHKMGLLPTQKDQWSNELDHKKDAINKEIDQMLLEKRELQLIRRDFNKNRRAYADQELFKRDIATALKKSIHIDIVSPPKTTYAYGQHALLVVLSDLHIGASVDVDGYTYNEDIAKQKLEQYRDRVVEYAKMAKPGVIYVENIGDSIEGAYMRSNQSYEITMKLSDQIKTAVKLISEFVVGLQQELGIEVYYTGIMGNHDRANGNKFDNLPDDGFQTVISMALSTISEQYDKLHVLEPDKQSEDHISVNGTNVKFVHGDLQNLSKSETLATSSQFDDMRYSALVGGHFHSLAIREESGLVIQSGSVIGPTSYSERLHFKASRSQVILDVDEHGVITPIPVIL